MRLPVLPASPTWRHWRRGPELAVRGGADDVQSANQRFLLYGVMPLWFVPAISDWAMHRRSRIQDTSGTKESLIHALMMTEAGVPVLMGLLAKVNPLTLSVMGTAAAAHGATALWDVSVATDEREVTPVEQHIHSFLEVLPLTAFAFTACLHWDQVRRALHGRHRTEDWKLLPKDTPLPLSYLLAIGGGITAFVALPYGEELLRCLRAQRERTRAAAQTKVSDDDVQA